MIQRKKKRIVLSTIIVLIISIIATGAVCIINNNKNNETQNIAEQLDFSSKSLIITTDEELTIEQSHNAKSINKLYSGKYIVKYDTEEQTKNAYENFKQNSKIKNVDIDVDVDVQLYDIQPMTISQNISGINFESWGTYTVGLNKTQTLINNKINQEEIVVAVIDTGFDLNNPILDEQNLKDRIDSRYKNITNNTTDITDKNKETVNGTEVLVGHGTHVGGIILDGTPDNVKILPIKVETDEGTMPVLYISEAIRYAIDQNVDVINLSLGIKDDNSTSVGIGIAQMQEAIQDAINNDIVVVAATGNDRIDCVNIYPVAYEGVIGVAALQTSKIIVTENNEIDGVSYISAKNSTKDDLSYAEFSNYGIPVDFAMPGKHILSLVPTDSYFSSFPILNGTSQAAPQMSAAIATIKSYNKSWKLNQIEEILQYYAEDLGTTGKDNDYGYGMVNFNNMQECTCNCENCDGIYCFGCTCADCTYHEQEEKTLERIEITTKPSKLEYTEGETFNPAGMVVTAVYSDNSKEIVTNYTYAPAGNLSTTDTKITITYEEKTVELPITVNEKQEKPPIPEKTLERIEITTKPNKLIYTEGETFNPSGMVVKAVYSDNSKEIVTNYTYAPTGNLSTSNTKITVTYEGKTAEISITVNSKQVEQPEITLKKIEITALPNKTTYKEGEKFDKTGMVVKAIYSDGTSKVINNYNCFPITELTTSNKKITVSYTENGISVSTTIDIVVNTENTNNNGNNNNNNNNNNQNNNNNNSNKPNNNNSNNQNNNNNVTIIGNTTSKDNTVKEQDLAFTGVETYIIPAVIIIIIGGTIAFIKYRQYKDI